MTTSVPARRHVNYKDILILTIFFLATIQCVRSIFLVNASLLDLPSYASGTANMPFQGRVAMMPLIRYAEHSSFVHRAAAYVDWSLRYPRFANPVEHYSPEKLVCIVAGLLATLLSVGFLLNYGRRRMGRFWWLSAALFLAMLYVSYAARSEAQFWYPYDLVHFAVFGVSAALIMEGKYVPAFCLFAVDIPIRETSIYLVPLLLSVGYVRRERRVIGWAIAMVALWLPIHFEIVHRFAGNKNDAYIHWLFMRKAIINPLHWPQTWSAFGFLFIPSCLGFRRLTEVERWFVFGAVPGLVLTALYGIWYESRIWDEWLVPMSILLGLQAIRTWAEPGLSEFTTDDESEMQIAA